MMWLTISGYAAVCIAIFALFRIPLNRKTVPSASVGGIVLVFALIQVMNFYHPYSNTGRHQISRAPSSLDETGVIVDTSSTASNHEVIAWFPQTGNLPLREGNAAEVTFDSIPGKVFTGEVLAILPADIDDVAATQSQIPVTIWITDERYPRYAKGTPSGSSAQAVVYGGQLNQLAPVRQTLLRMAAWLNYLTPIS